MNDCTVVNLHRGKFDIYIGRGNGSIYGNPFTHLRTGLGSVLVASRDEAVEAFDQWLDGTAWQEVEPDRRLRILDSLPQLAGKRLGCFCHPLPCHGDSLARRVNALMQEALHHETLAR